MEDNYLVEKKPVPVAVRGPEQANCVIIDISLTPAVPYNYSSI